MKKPNENTPALLLEIWSMLSDHAQRVLPRPSAKQGRGKGKHKEAMNRSMKKSKKRC